MRYKVLAYLLGTLLFYLGVFMILPLLWSITDDQVIMLSFLFSSAASIIIGLLLRYKKKPPEDISIKESFSFVAMAWPISALLGCLPFLFSGTFSSFIDAYFESMSGFTTTGATVLKDIEILPQSILLWRSLTQWLGGMGIIVLFVAMLPKLGIRSINLLKAEVPGPGPERMVPRLAETAKRLWIVYLVISAAQFILLLASGLNIFDSLTHTFTTMPTGGFSNYNGSIAAFNNVRAEMVIIFFMILAGGNFTLYYAIWQKQWKQVLRDTELRFYLFGIFIATAVLTISIFPVYSTILEAARRASFQAISIITTTGYVTADYDSWPSLARVMLFLSDVFRWFRRVYRGGHETNPYSYTDKICCQRSTKSASSFSCDTSAPWR
jgi:trk system potassium uptake protein